MNENPNENTPTPRVRTLAEIAKWLEWRGWKREIAGDDFDRACKIVRGLQKMPDKGLIISGGYGSGKTSFVKTILPEGVSFYAMPQQEAVFDPNYSPGNGDIILDDVGCEHTVNNYGVHIEAFADFIMRWHAKPKGKGRGRLFITTNLGTHDFEQRYGGRVVSRLKDLCLAAHFNGGDKREWEIAEDVGAE